MLVHSSVTPPNDIPFEYPGKEFKAGLKLLIGAVSMPPAIKSPIL